MSENDRPAIPTEAATASADGYAWRPQSGALGPALAVAAAVIAAGLMFAPRLTAYSEISPWMVSALGGFVLVLGGACVVFAATLAAAAARGGLIKMGAVLGAAGLALTAVAVALAVVLPTPTETIMVQFTDLYGRVQLEYCPTLPASFEATASRNDLLGSSTILPVRVSAETCGNADYSDGVWVYLNREAITVSDRP
jgi:hypothetical protein